ncbi:hypothetical protein ABFV83_08970 [Lacrimispora sp. BS-2]|uniref:Antigen I/II N-terminal domain-containing protein n=1 Tax=Lacrimispora sp. BS-2 TaxID=3151850 RepID=A0AAU7PU43_9FIRM
MKKLNLLTASIIFSTLILLTSCGKNTDSASAISETVSAEISIKESNTNAETKNDLDAIGNADVELNIPAKFIGKQTQDDLNELCKEKGYKSITLNGDGSATYILTKKQHKKMMNELKDNINSSISEMIGSEDYPDFTDVTANENFTEFEISTKSTELNMADRFSILGFYMYGGMYNIFNGTAADNISVKFVNADSGEEILTANSKDAGK